MTNPNSVTEEADNSSFSAASSEQQQTLTPDSGPGEAELDGGALAPDEEISRLRKERDELKDQLLRNRAEFSNYQKRVKQQADSDRAYAIGNLARDLLEAIDNLQRATDALRSSANEGISSGLEMVQKQFLATLAKYGVEPIHAMGEPFDPNQHDALMQQPSAEHPEGTVVAELAKGYKIHDRVLRPSKVAVSAKH